MKQKKYEPITIFVVLIVAPSLHFQREKWTFSPRRAFCFVSFLFFFLGSKKRASRAKPSQKPVIRSSSCFLVRIHTRMGKMETNSKPHRVSDRALSCIAASWECLHTQEALSHEPLAFRSEPPGGRDGTEARPTANLANTNLCVCAENRTIPREN